MIAVGPADARYPRRLLDLRAPPDPLWVEGDLDALSARTVTIVGTRRTTPYGARVARELASACAAAGVVIVSGLAQGVDSAAHQGALDLGGRTIAVLGAGIDSYLGGASAARRRLAHAVRAHGALVSEFPPTAPAQRWTFAQRDATLAALGEITVVVEAPAGSGALITAAEAKRLRRSVFAVPGPLGAEASTGTNELIARGSARIVTGPVTLLIALGIGPTSEPATGGDSHAADQRILHALARDAADPDALAHELGLDPRELALRIAELIVRGDVEASPDGRVARR